MTENGINKIKPQFEVPEQEHVQETDSEKVKLKFWGRPVLELSQEC